LAGMLPDEEKGSHKALQLASRSKKIAAALNLSRGKKKRESRR